MKSKSVFSVCWRKDTRCVGWRFGARKNESWNPQSKSSFILVFASIRFILIFFSCQVKIFGNNKLKSRKYSKTSSKEEQSRLSQQ